ncbi:MAG: VWA domain-containing protein [Bacteroidetes bacterium]|nr:MAG: VWA domain-containing protein [Bacteroidota bacterium]
MTKFEHPEALYLLFLLVPLGLLFLLFWQGRRRAVKRFGESSLVTRLMPERPVFKHTLKFILAAVALILLVVALANPQIGQSYEKVQRSGVDLMIALDISRSMMAEDEKPSRLAKAKQFISSLTEELAGDRIGLILFAGNAYLQVPLTSDYVAARTLLRAINPEIAGSQGTNIGEAIRVADEAFDRSEAEFRTMLIISDGEDHEAAALEMARTAAGKGMTIYTMGVGSPKGSPIPEYRNGRQVGYKQDRSGSIVLSKLNETMLQQVAATGNGSYFRLTQARADASNFARELAGLEKRDFEEYVFTDYEDYFQVFLALALLFLVLEFFVTERRLTWFRDWKIFQ